MTRFIAALLLALAPAAAAAAVFDAPADRARLEAVLAPALSALSGVAVLEGRFDQERRLAGLPRPVTASGTFLYATDLGLAWTTREPFASTLLLNEDGAFTREGDAPLRPLAGGAGPVLELVAALLDALLRLDLDALDDHFETYALAGADGWTLGLVPDGALADVLERVTARGTTHLTRLELVDVRGEVTVLELSGLVAAPAATDAQRARLRVD